MLPVRLRHFWICKKSPGVRGKHAGAQQRDYGLQLKALISSFGFESWDLLMNKSNAFIRKSFRNCCYVSQHYSSHLRLARQQDWTTSLDGYNRKEHWFHADIRNSAYYRMASLYAAQCSYLLYWSNRHGDQPHSCMPGTHFGYPLVRRNRTPRTAKDTCAICL